MHPGEVEVKTPARRKPIPRITSYVHAQKHSVHVRLGVAQWIIGLLPYGAANELRSYIYRWAGFKGIHPKVYIAGKLDLNGDGDIYGRLHIGELTTINTPSYIELNSDVRIGKRVGLGHHLVIITSNHELGPAAKRMSKLTSSPITIGDGVWIGARVTVLPGVSIGPGAFVMTGALVSKDVPANAKVAGNPARLVGWLEP